MEILEKKEERSDKWLRFIYEMSSLLEKWRIARFMAKEGYSLERIEDLTSVSSELVDMSVEQYKEVIGKTEKMIEEGMWGDSFVMGLASLYKKGETARENMENALRDAHRKIIASHKKEARLKIAYKLLISELQRNARTDLWNITHITNLSKEDVEHLVDLRYIRFCQERKTKKEIAQSALEAQLDRATVAKIVDLNPSKLDELLAQQEEDTFKYSFLHRENPISS